MQTTIYLEGPFSMYDLSTSTLVVWNTRETCLIDHSGAVYTFIIPQVFVSFPVS